MRLVLIFVLSVLALNEAKAYTAISDDKAASMAKTMMQFVNEWHAALFEMRALKMGEQRKGYALKAVKALDSVSEEFVKEAGRDLEFSDQGYSHLNTYSDCNIATGLLAKFATKVSKTSDDMLAPYSGPTFYRLYLQERADCDLHLEPPSYTNASLVFVEYRNLLQAYEGAFAELAEMTSPANASEWLSSPLERARFHWLVSVDVPLEVIRLEALTNFMLTKASDEELFWKVKPCFDLQGEFFALAREAQDKVEDLHPPLLSFTKTKNFNDGIGACRAALFDGEKNAH